MFLNALLRSIVVVAALLPAWSGAAPVGLVTIVDGEAAAVLRGTQRHAVAEGLRLQADDIVRTGAGTRLLRLELADGTTLDLGASTELLLQPGAALGGRAATLYLARGWLKIGAKPGDSDGVGGIAAAGFDLGKVSGGTVVHLAPQALLVFVESGAAELGERGEGRAGNAQVLRDGDAFVRRGSAPGAVLKRPPADLLQDLPRGFVDSLPRRAARFQNTRVEPGPGEEAGYDEVAGWINGEPALRQAFLPRFAGRARDRQFRAALVAEMRAHPEWDRMLFPEKYRPKPVLAAKRPAPAASAASDAAPAAAAATPVAANLPGPTGWTTTPREALTTTSTMESR